MLRDAYVAKGDWASLETLYAETNDWTGLAEALTQASETLEEPASVTMLSLRAAEIYGELLGDPSRAARGYERALSMDPRASYSGSYTVENNVLAFAAQVQVSSLSFL